MKCWACQSELVEGQKFCCECDHWQNWRRYFGFSTSVLSLLVALVSVLGVVTPIMLDAFNRIDRPYVEVSGSHSANFVSLRLQVANLSTEAVVMPRRISCFEDNPPADRSNAAYHFNAQTNVFIPDGGVEMIDYVFAESFNTVARNTIEIPHEAGLRCTGTFPRSTEDRVVMQFRGRALVHFLLERSQVRYYP